MLKNIEIHYDGLERIVERLRRQASGRNLGSGRHIKIYRLAEENGELEKRCSACDQWLLADEESFYPVSSYYGPLSPYCRTCTVEKRVEKMVQKLEEAEHKTEVTG